MTREQFILQIEATQGAFRRFLVALCCGDAAQADDIAQEAYMKAYLKCDALENADKFKAWIFRIGYNAFVDSRRSAMVSDGYDRAQAVASAESADEAFRYQELYAALRLAAAQRALVGAAVLHGRILHQGNRLIWRIRRRIQ